MNRMPVGSMARSGLRFGGPVAIGALFMALACGCGGSADEDGPSQAEKESACEEMCQSAGFAGSSVGDGSEGETVCACESPSCAGTVTVDACNQFCSDIGLTTDGPLRYECPPGNEDTCWCY